MAKVREAKGSPGLFRLMRYFAVASAVALVAVAVVLYLFYRQTSVTRILDSAEQHNVVLAQSLSNALAPVYTQYQSVVAVEGVEEAVKRPEFEALQKEIELLVAGLPVLKLVIYDLTGLIVYSSDRDDIGAIGADDEDGFKIALSMEPYSEIEYRDWMYTLSGIRHDVSVVETYLHFHPAKGQMMGVFELYSDVSDSVADAQRDAKFLLAVLAVVFALLYSCLQLVVWRANRILTSQYAALEHSRADARAKNRLLLNEIVHRNQVEADLRLARDEAQSASNAKSRFLANMSHELRTPLNAIIGFSEIISEKMFGTDDLERYFGYARDIRASGEHLLALVNDILDLARIEAGKTPVAFQTLDVGKFLADTLRTLEPEIARYRNKLTLDCGADIGMAATDRELLGGILINLVANAAKFTCDGHIEVSVSRKSGKEDGWLLFRVRDNGIGIDADRIDGLFDEFSQADNAYSRRHEGCGLGLAISRQYAEALGGRIEISSKRGSGTTVSLSIPDASYRSAQAEMAAE